LEPDQGNPEGDSWLSLVVAASAASEHREI